MSIKKNLKTNHAFILAGALAMVACGSTADTTDLDPASDTSELELEYGGFEEGDEEPMFGDASFGLLAEDAEDPVGDEGETEPERPAGERPNTTRPAPGDLPKIAFTAVWGKLRLDPNVQQRTDWTGGLVVRGAAISRVRTIRFEQNDHLLPRQSRDHIRWASVTGPHHDGVQALVHVADRNGAVRFQTAPFAVTIPVRELNDYRRVFRVGDNQVAISAFVVNPQDCATGHMRGRWSPANSDGIGQFIGRWMSEDGTLHGHVRGRYGVRANGDQVWAGKVINARGQFIGRMRGTWDNGHFEGNYAGRGGKHGAIRGRYANDPNNPGGYFAARWAERCGDRPSTMPERPERPSGGEGDGSGERPERPTGGQ